MASAGSFPIEVVLKGLDLLSGPVGRANASLARLASRSESLKKAGTAAAGVGRSLMAGGAVMAAGLSAGLSKMADFELGMANAANALSTNSGLPKEMESLKRQAVELGNLLPGSTGDMLALLTAMKMAGAATADLEAGSFKAAAKLSALFGVTQGFKGAQAGMMFQEMANGLGMAGGDAEYFADQLQRMSYATGMTMENAHEAIGRTASSLKMLGIQGKDESDLVLATLGTLKQAGMSGAEAGSGVKMLLQKLAKVQSKVAGGDTAGAHAALANEGLAAAGVDLSFFEKKNGKFQALENVIGQLQKISDMPNEMQRSLAMTGLFGEKAGKVPSLITIPKINEQLRKMQDQEPMQKRLDRMLKTLSLTWEALTGTTTNFIVTALTPLGNAMQPVIKRMNDLLGKFEAWANENPKLLENLGKVAVGLTGLAVFGGGALWTIGKLAAAMPTLAAGLKLVSTAAFANPWLLALVAGGALLAANWDKVGPVFGEVADQIGEVGGSIGDLLKLMGLMNDASAKATGETSGWADAAMFLAKGIQMIATGLEAVVASVKSLGAIATGDFDNIGKPFEKLGIRDPLGVRKSILDQSANDASAGPIVGMRSGRTLRGVEAPVGMRSSKILSATGRTNSITIHAPQTVSVSVSGGDPETVKGAVLDAMRANTAEMHRLMSSYQQVVDRGRFVPQGCY